METCDLTHLFILTDQNTDEERYSSDCLSASLTNTQGHKHTHRHTQRHTNTHTHTQTQTHTHRSTHTQTSMSQTTNSTDCSYTTSGDTNCFFHFDSLISFSSFLIHPSLFSFHTLFHAIHPFSQDFMFMFKSSPSTFCIQQFSASFFKIHSTIFR